MYNRISLTSIIDGNKIGFEGTLALAKGIELGKSIRKLQMERCNVGDEGAKLLSNAIRVTPTMQLLVLSKHIIYLYKDGNNIGDEGVIAIAEAVKETKIGFKLHLCNR